MRCIVVAILATVVLAASRPATAGTAVAGLVDEPWAAGFTQPTAIAFLPGGDASRFFVIEKAGAIKFVDRSGPPPGWTLVGNIGVCTAFEMGLLGIALYPDFDVTHHVYLYRTENDGGCGAPRENQVIRATIDPLLDPGSLTVILGGIRTNVGAHNGGGLRIAPDGTLYVGVGENGLGGNGCPGTNTNPYAQDPNVLEGKILRINRDGTIPADNPFVGLPAHRAEVFALGFRNPWRFHFDPMTGKLWLGDLGAVAVEEIDIVTAGANYGWPHCEGTLPAGCELPGDVAPIYVYRHDGLCAGEETLPATLGKSVTGGSFAGGAFGAFENTYVFGDFSSDAMHLATPTPARDGIAGTPLLISTAAGRPVDVVTGPDGAVYYTAIVSGEIRRISSSFDLHSGRRLVLSTSDDPAKKRLDVQSVDTSIGLGLGNGSFDDPVEHGGSLRVRTADGCGGPCDDTYALANQPGLESWSYTGKAGDGAGYRYRSKLTGLKVLVKPGRKLRVFGRGAFGHELAAAPGPVDVTLALGLHRYCFRFGGSTAFHAGASFRASDAAAPPTCAP